MLLDHALYLNTLQDWMRVVSNDSKVFSVVNRRRGEKGYRLLQGDNLCSLFLSLIQQQVEKKNFLLFLVEQYLKNVTTEMIYISTNMIGSMCTCICVCAHMHTELIYVSLVFSSKTINTFCMYV